MHNKDVIHSDIKSVCHLLYSFYLTEYEHNQDNVLISEDGIPLICDFGTSRMLVNSLSIGGHASSEKLVGSLRRLAAEFFTGYQAEHTEDTDIWAFGMTTYVSAQLI